MNLEPIKPEDREMYTCSPCWLNHRKETEATILVHDTYGVLKQPTTTALCGNHAEVLDIQDKEGN